MNAIRFIRFAGCGPVDNSLKVENCLQLQTGCPCVVSAFISCFLRRLYFFFLNEVSDYYQEK